MTPIILIPARMDAGRLPGKPLADIGGMPMVVRVWRQAVAAELGPVAVAAGDAEIVAAVQAVGGTAVLTDPQLASGSDRIWAALCALDPDGRYDTVINLQGDMPFVDPMVLHACLDVLKCDPACDIATAAAAESGPSDRENPDVVKAVLTLTPDGRSGRAHYFTRGVLFGEGPVWRHIGLYAYRRAALQDFVAAPPSPLEHRERLEQLRALELGLRLSAAIIGEAPISVDTPGDLAVARAYANLKDT